MPKNRITSVLLVMLLLLSCGKHDKSSRADHGVSADKNMRVEKKPEKTIFTVQDIDKRSTHVRVVKNKTIFEKIAQPIVIVTIFSSWCPPCRGVLPYLSKLQRKYSSDIFILGLLVNSSMDNKALKKFMLKYNATFFISNHADNDALAKKLIPEEKYSENYPIPMTLIFKNGKLRYDIAGALPFEMAETIVEQLKKEK